MSIVSNEHQHGSTGAVDLDKLDRLHAAATPGKWKLWSGEVRADLDGSSDVSKSELVARTYSRPDPETGAERATNAYLIAELQRAWPAVSAELRTLRARVGELEAQLNPPLDAEDERILAMSDEEIIAEANLSPEEWERLGAVGSATRDWAAMVTKERRRAESAEARVKELETKARERDQALSEYESQLEHGTYAERAQSTAFLWDKFVRGHMHFWEYLGEEARYGVIDFRDVIEKASAKRIRELESQLAAAREETRWRLVEERPAEEGFVLAWCEGEPIRRIWFSKHVGFEGLGPANYEPTHWLPLPRLPAILEVEAKGG